jgi:hypothetical protein
VLRVLRCHGLLALGSWCMAVLSACLGSLCQLSSLCQLIKAAATLASRCLMHDVAARRWVCLCTC